MPKLKTKISWRKYKEINANINSLTDECSHEAIVSSQTKISAPCSKVSNKDPPSINILTSEPSNSHESYADRKSYHRDTEFDYDSNLSSNSGFSIIESDGQEFSSIQSNMPSILETNTDREAKTLSLREQLSAWSVKNNVTQVAVTELLKILRQHPCHTDLPSDARSLVKTPRKVDFLKLSNGLYYHFGIAEGVKSLIVSYGINDVPQTLDLLINVDGLPLCKSTGSQFWPILGSLSYSLKSCPSVFPIGIFHSTGKPEISNEFMSYFVEEMKVLQSNGLQIGNDIFALNLRGLVCDAPARAYVTCTKSHSGYLSCSKCVIRGINFKERICYPGTSECKRTDEMYRDNCQDGHHKGRSFLLELQNFGMVSQVPLDYMHLVCLGVMRKLLKIWSKGERKFRLSHSQISQVSEHLLSLKTCITSDFSRKSRSLFETDRYKATELRQILLYTGPLVFSEILRKDFFVHFLILHCAVKILTQRNLHCTMLPYAQSLLECFVKGFSVLYGEEYISYNVHGLLHLCQDSENFGLVDEFSAFQFENYMQYLKKLIRKAEKPLEQVVCRLKEKYFISLRSTKAFSKHEQPFELCKEHDNGIMLLGIEGTQYREARLKRRILCIDRPNNFCLINDGTFVEIQNFVCMQGQGYVIGKKFIDSECLYREPCDSSILGIKVVKKLSDSSFCPIEEVVCKCLALCKGIGFAMFPLNSDGVEN